MARYQNDPYWLTARFSSPCKRCGNTIKKGADAFYFPKGKSIFCDAPSCGKSESDNFTAADFDESVYNGNF